MIAGIAIFFFCLAAILFYVAYLSTIAPWETRWMEVFWLVAPLLGGVVFAAFGVSILLLKHGIS